MINILRCQNAIVKIIFKKRHQIKIKEITQKMGGFSFGDFKIAHHVTVYCRMNVELINV